MCLLHGCNLYRLLFEWVEVLQLGITSPHRACTRRKRDGEREREGCEIEKRSMWGKAILSRMNSSGADETSDIKFTVNLSWVLLSMCLTAMNQSSEPVMHFRGNCKRLKVIELITVT